MMETQRKRQGARLRDPVRSAARLPRLLEQYLLSCRGTKEGGRGETLFPNLAGFCRWMGIGIGALDRLRDTKPRMYDRICTVLEDEALNSSPSATLISGYVKQRLWREPPDPKTSLEASGQLRLVFEHDITEDGQ